MFSSAELVWFALVALALVLSPGPNMIYFFSRTLCQGRGAGMVSLALLPVLGAQYGEVLEAGELVPVFDAGSGAFRVDYYEHHFPLDPRDSAVILRGVPPLPEVDRRHHHQHRRKEGHRRAPGHVRQVQAHGGAEQLQPAAEMPFIEAGNG